MKNDIAGLKNAIAQLKEFVEFFEGFDQGGEYDEYNSE